MCLNLQAVLESLVYSVEPEREGKQAKGRILGKDL